MKTISQIIDFLKVHAKVNSDRGVAKLLGMEAPALFNHKKRGTIPYKKLTTYCEDHGLSLGDILQLGEPLNENNITKGEETMFLKDLLKSQALNVELLLENKLLRAEIDAGGVIKKSQAREQNGN